MAAETQQHSSKLEQKHPVESDLSRVQTSTPATSALPSVVPAEHASDLQESARPPSVLLTEVEALRNSRDWRKARRVLDAASASVIDIRDRRRVLELTATAAAEASKHRISSNAVYELAQIEPRTASTWIAIGDVALARGNYKHADTAAREALTLEPSSPDAYILLSVSFAGLGWFDQASECLAHLDQAALTERQSHQIGEAVNRWATAKSMAFPLAMLAALLAGVLAISVGLSVPIITRKLRLRQLSHADEATNELFVAAAMANWEAKTKARFLAGVGIVLPIAAYLSLVFLPR